MIRRWAAAAVATLTLAACGPGTEEVDAGACPFDLTMSLDPLAFCQERAFWECRREQVAGRIDGAAFTECTEAIEDRCAGVAWPAGCSPATSDGCDCIGLLRRADLLSTPLDDLHATHDDCALCE